MARSEVNRENNPMEFLWNSLSSDAQRVSWYIAKPISFTHESIDREYLLVCARLDFMDHGTRIDVLKGVKELRDRGVLGEDATMLDLYRRQLRTLLKNSSQIAQNRQLREDEREAINKRLRKVVEYQKEPWAHRHMEQPQYYLSDDLQQFMEINFVFLGGEESI